MNQQLHIGRERTSCTYWVVPLQKWLSLTPIHLEFVVDKVALCQVSSQVLQFSLLSFIPPIVHAHIHQSPLLYYRGAEKSLARPTSRCILFDGENISFDATLVIYIYINSTNFPPIIIINRIYEH